jgi:hypothetical protein
MPVCQEKHGEEALAARTDAAGAASPTTNAIANTATAPVADAASSAAAANGHAASASAANRADHLN